MGGLVYTGAGLKVAGWLDGLQLVPFLLLYLPFETRPHGKWLN